MSAVVPFPTSYVPETPVVEAHYRLSEDQEFALYETRNALRGVIHLVDSIRPGNTLNINPEEVSALLSLLAARLPSSDDMEFVTR